MKYKVGNTLMMIGTFLAFTSCDYNIHDRPGPQVSFTVQESKSHNTFLAGYTSSDSLLNGFKINEIFIEKRFRRRDKLFRPKVINCCQSQLVIVTKDGLTDYGTVWAIRGFTGCWSSYSVYKDLEGVAAPDSIPIEVFSINGSDSSKAIQRIVLHIIPQRD